MTDPRKVLDEAVEAGARAAQPYAFDDAFWLTEGRQDWHQKRVQANARACARAAILAALPVIGGAIVAAAEAMPSIQRINPNYARSNEPAHVAAAQREFIERMMGS